MSDFAIAGRKIGPEERPFVIAEIGINHEGDFSKALRMIDDAAAAGCECVKFQCHIVEDEMIPAAGRIIPVNAPDSIWDIMVRCSFDEDQDRELKRHVESHGMIHLSTPFSRAAADRLEKIGVVAYKIGSGECNNHPLIDHIARFRKPVILSTGMNDIASIRPSVEILRRHAVPFALMHCTSMYPTPYDKVRLGALAMLQNEFPGVPIGLSDHTIDNFACYGAVALGASLLERHFTSDKNWPGPDIAISMDPADLAELVKGSAAIHAARGGEKTILPEEKATIDFAYATVVTIAPIRAGDIFTRDNLWVKRPGTGPIPARDFESILGKRAKIDLAPDVHLLIEEIT
ncbi:MAG: N-acetylneuraminate synthase family protein [Candidatus Hydrogenedentota bacterium]